MVGVVELLATTDLVQLGSDLLAQAMTALDLGQTDAATALLDQALEVSPNNVEASRMAGFVALMTGACAAAVVHLRRAFARCPDDPMINMTLGCALIETGVDDEGLTRLQRACELGPNNAEAWYNLGAALQTTHDPQHARDALERSISIAPGYIKARNRLAYTQNHLGDTAAAVTTLRGTLSRQPDSVEAWVALGNVKTEPLRSEDVSQLQNLLRRQDVPDDSRIPLSFTLAKALEDQSDYASAFDVVSHANALKRRHVYWSRNEERERVEAIAHAFSRPLPPPDDATLGKEVIFVAHLPRSGSTLTEQILASHPNVQGGDELFVLPHILDEESERRGRPFAQWAGVATSADWRRLGVAYLERTRYLREHHPRFTDKTPDNWAFVGAALAMLPGARVVSARRDPLETSFACYRQLFQDGCHFTYDLDDIAAYYAGHERLSALWREKFPQRFFESQYELLQSDTEGQIRRLLAFCDLPFDPACLAFHQTRRTVLTFSAAQVREPMKLNTARSARYGSRLDALREKLRAAGVPIAPG